MTNYIILGIIQGIVEWIPISSQGAVALASYFLIEGFQPVEVALFLHLGTFLAVLLSFKKDWLNLMLLKDKVLLRFLSIAVIVSGLVGFLLYGLVKNVAVGNVLLIMTGCGLLVTAFFHKKRIKLKIDLDALAVLSGLLQGLAVIPGLSRSGATVFGLSLGKFETKEILKISYMMSGPAVLGMAVFLYFENAALFLEAWPALLFSFLIGYLSLEFMLKIVGKINFFKFALFFSFLCFFGAALSLLI